MRKEASKRTLSIIRSIFVYLASFGGGIFLGYAVRVFNNSMVTDNTTCWGQHPDLQVAFIYMGKEVSTMWTIIGVGAFVVVGIIIVLCLDNRIQNKEDAEKKQLVEDTIKAMGAYMPTASTIAVAIRDEFTKMISEGTIKITIQRGDSNGNQQNATETKKDS